MNNPYTIIRRFIQRERAMRERVFRNRPTELARKVGEADAALAALDMLAAADRCLPVTDAEIDDHMGVVDGVLYFEDELGTAQIKLPEGWCIARFGPDEAEQTALFDD